MKTARYSSKCWITKLEAGSGIALGQYSVSVANGMHDEFEFKMDKTDFNNLKCQIGQKVMVHLELHDDVEEP